MAEDSNLVARLVRYSVNCIESGSGGDYYGRLLPESSGEWVKYKDVVNLNAEQAETISRLRAALSKIKDSGNWVHPMGAALIRIAIDALHGVPADETKPIRTESANVSDMGTTVGPQGCTCRDGARYRFIRQGEDELPSEHEKAFAQMWADITLKGYWREAMDNRIDAAMQQLDGR